MIGFPCYSNLGTGRVFLEFTQTGQALQKFRLRLILVGGFDLTLTAAHQTAGSIRFRFKG